jgi:hypothetical protein
MICEMLTNSIVRQIREPSLPRQVSPATEEVVHVQCAFGDTNKTHVVGAEAPTEAGASDPQITEAAEVMDGVEVQVHAT